MDPCILYTIYTVEEEDSEFHELTRSKNMTIKSLIIVFTPNFLDIIMTIFIL